MFGVWSAGGDLATARSGLAGCGTQTAGLCAGGWTEPASAKTEEYDGSSWSAGGDLATARAGLAGCGTQTVGLCAGGTTGTFSVKTEEYDGSSWTSSGDLAGVRSDLAGCGTQAAGLSFGGFGSGVVISAKTEEYNESTAPLKIQVLGTDQAKTGTSLAGTYSFLPAAGDWVIAVVGADTDVVGTIAMTGGTEVATFDTTTQPVTATNSGNVLVSPNIAKVTAIGSGSSTVTISGLTSESHAASFYLIRGLDATPFDKSSTATGTSTSPSSGATATLSQANELIIGAVGTEGPGQTGDDTAGTWTTGTGNVSGYEQRVGTTGGGAAGNITISTAAEIVSATTAQTAAKTGITSRDWAALVATFKAQQYKAIPPNLIKSWRKFRPLLMR